MSCTGLGGTGHYDVYPHVYKAIGSRDPLNADARERLWRAFRRALLKVGIQPLPRTSGTHFMTDEFVRQAGVPLAFADDLALKMLSYAKRLGIPDEDDQEGLLNWQASLLNRLNAPFSGTARKAVERDTQGYYTRALWLRKSRPTHLRRRCGGCTWQGFPCCGWNDIHQARGDPAVDVPRRRPWSAVSAWCRRHLRTSVRRHSQQGSLRRGRHVSAPADESAR